MGMKVLKLSLVLTLGFLIQACDQPPSEKGSANMSSLSQCPTSLAQSYVYVNGARLEPNQIDISIPRGQNIELAWGPINGSYGCGNSDGVAGKPNGFWNFSDNFSITDFCAIRNFSQNGVYTVSWYFTNLGSCGLTMTTPFLRIHVAN